MVGRWAQSMDAKVLLIGIFLLSVAHLASSSDCWESCFIDEERSLDHAEYEQIMGLVQSFKKAMITDANTGTGTSNGTALLFDTTLPTGTDRMDAEIIPSIQKRIGQILTLSLPMLSNFNPGFLVKYDRDSAWTCDDWKCLGRCEMFDVLENEGSSSLVSSDSNEAFATASDNLDGSCEMASQAALSSTCAGSTHNIFAVAIVNSNFKKAESDYTQLDDTLLSSGLDILNEMDFGSHLFDDESDNPFLTEEFNFYCDKHFPKKAVIGTYSAAERDLAEFPSASTLNWPGYTQITYSSGMKRATDRIASCMSTKCCSNRQTTYQPNASGSCSRFTKGQSHSYFR